MASTGIPSSLPRLFFVLALAFPLAAWAQSTGSAPVPVPKAEPRVTFVADAEDVPATLVVLPPVDPGEIAAVRAANARPGAKRLQVGITRQVGTIPEARGEALAWREIDGGMVARWKVISPGAEALRLEVETAGLPAGAQVRFAGSGDPDTVYAHAVIESPSWSPVLEGDIATVEVYFPRAAAEVPASLGIARVAHQFAGPRGSDKEIFAKVGESEPCNVDLICESSTNTALANIGKSVARMDFVDAGVPYLCTGTLIQSTDGSTTPYFYSAAHCIDNQAAASTLVTHWFFERTGCGTGSTSPAYVQRTGGATLLYANANSDVLLLRLNSTPPAGAWFAGWDASAFSLGASVTGVHHPSGDWKKVSRGTVAGFASPGAPYDSMTRSNWTSGVTEGGSSGSGLFGAVGSPATDYRLRGGLWGGPQPVCGGTNYDFYSRLELAYTAIRQWIDPPPPPPNTLAVTKAGTGTGLVQSAPPGINCGGTCSAIFAAGTAVTLTATPDAGSLFGGWGGACSGTGACIVTMDAGKAVSATFNAQPATATLTIAKSGGGSGTVTSSQGGINCGTACTTDVAFGQVLTLNAAASSGSVFTGWSGACSGIQPCTLTLDAAKSVTAAFATSASPVVVNVSTGSIAFGGQSMGTTSPASPIVITNVGANTVVFSGIGTSDPQFAHAGNCTNIAPGFNCTLNATFRPSVTSIALGQGTPVTGQLTIPSNAAGSPHLVALSGSAEKSLVAHYYRSILRRAPDAGGKAFWEAEAQRLAGLGISVNEAWFSMAMQFYGSAEYAAFNRGNADFVTDLYNTFFNRAPDGGGLSYWNNELFNGLPRGVALASFMFSPEFRNFSQGIFGSAAVRPEVDTVVDFYRGLLGRLPDSGGFGYWLQRFRAAQCGGQAAVLAEVEAISSAFANGGEYAGRARSNAQFVGDLYNAFLRRGGDRPGVLFWINELVAGARTRDRERLDFVASAEFQARVSAILAAPCLP